MNDMAQLLERIKQQTGIKDPVMQALLIRVASDAASLHARATTGEDVGKELAIVAATAANLDERARHVVGQQFMAWTQGILAKALGVAIAAI